MLSVGSFDYLFYKMLISHSYCKVFWTRDNGFLPNTRTTSVADLPGDGSYVTSTTINVVQILLLVSGDKEYVLCVPRGHWNTQGI